MDAAQVAVQGFTFYSLLQCTHQQLLSHSKYSVNIYHHTMTNQIFVVKELPYSHNLVKIYRILKDSQTLNIIPICGLSIVQFKREKQEKRPNRKLLVENEEHRENRNSQNLKNVYMRLWMQKYQKTIAELVEERRKKLAPFTLNQVKSFMFQMLTTLRILQKKGISHRDIKPQNILYHQGRYFLCDFDEAVLTKRRNSQKKPDQIMSELEYTTILYSTPKFLKSIKQNNYTRKYFDPYKMDVYSFGLTLLYFCSLGKFSVDDRHLYLYSESGTHQQFIDEERRKYIRKDPELKVLNNILKLMLEEDQFKRDDFQTLNEKIVELLGIDNQSEQSYSTKSNKIKRQKRQKLRKSHGKGFNCWRLKTSEKFLIFVFTLTILIYFFLLIF